MRSALPTYQTTIEPLALACLGTGVAATLAATEFDPTKSFGSQEAMLACVISHAEAVALEWERRYGRTGAYPGRFDNDALLALMTRFGRFFARALVRCRHARPDMVIRDLFNELDPDYREPRLKPGMPDSGLLVLADFQDDNGVQIWRAGVFDNEQDARSEWEAWRHAVCPAAQLVGFQLVTATPRETAAAAA